MNLQGPQINTADFVEKCPDNPRIVETKIFVTVQRSNGIHYVAICYRYSITDCPPPPPGNAGPMKSAPECI
jgi:hypothetical protein